MQWLTDLWLKALEPTLSGVWESTPFWRLLALSLLVIAGLACVYRKPILAWLMIPETIEHDLGVFDASNKLLSESEILGILEWIGSNDSYHRRDWYALTDYVDYLTQVGNQFLDPELRSTATELANSLNELQWFCAKHFFMHEPNSAAGDNPRYCLYPNLNVDRGGTGAPEEIEKYRQFSTQLGGHVISAQSAYKSFRQQIKTKLLI